MQAGFQKLAQLASPPSKCIVSTHPGKSWNLRKDFSRPGKSWEMTVVMESHGIPPIGCGMF